MRKPAFSLGDGVFSSRFLVECRGSSGIFPAAGHALPGAEFSPAAEEDQAEDKAGHCRIRKRKCWDKGNPNGESGESSFQLFQKSPYQQLCPPPLNIICPKWVSELANLSSRVNYQLEDKTILWRKANPTVFAIGARAIGRVSIYPSPPSGVTR